MSCHQEFDVTAWQSNEHPKSSRMEPIGSQKARPGTPAGRAGTMCHLIGLKTSYLPLSCPDDRRSSPDTGQRLRPEVSLPDPAVVELNPHSVRRIDGALVARVDPDPAVRCSYIGPRTVRVSGLSHKVQVLSVLGDEGWSANIPITAILDTPVSASEVDRLRRGAAGKRGDSTNNTNNKRQISHRITPLLQGQIGLLRHNRLLPYPEELAGDRYFLPGAFAPPHRANDADGSALHRRALPRP
jgi:hypothetical protein